MQTSHIKYEQSFVKFREGWSLLALRHSRYQNTEKIMFQSVFEEMKSCMVNIESIYCRKCVILLHGQKYF